MIAKPALNRGALRAGAAAVNQPDLDEAGVARGLQVVFDHGDHIARREAMQVDRVFDRNPDRASSCMTLTLNS